MLRQPVPISDGRRQPVWQAPSWSWASMLGAVKYAGTETAVYEKDGTTHVHYIGDSMGSMQSAGGVAELFMGLSCLLLEADCSPAGLDSTSAVSSDYLKIAGFLIDVTNEILPLLASASNTLHGQELIVNGEGSLSLSSESVFWRHDTGGMKSNGKIYALRIGCTSFILYKEWSLLLRLVGPGDDCFERCGIVGVMNESSLASCIVPK